MKTKNLLLSVLNMLVFTCISSTFSFAQGTWTKKTDFPGLARNSAVGFSIGTKGYVGLGYHAGNLPLIDFWEWDQATDVWTRKADFPKNVAGKFVCFSIGMKGYVITDYDFIDGTLNELWEYDPSTDNWTQKAPFPGPARYMAVGFSLGTKGYFGIGYKVDMSPDPPYSTDFWEWDQQTNIWTQKADFVGVSSVGSVGFSIGNMGYIVTGFAGINGHVSSTYSEDLQEWNQAINLWTSKTDFGLLAYGRSDAVGFSIGSKGYIGTGLNGSNRLKDFWEWDQMANVWTKKADLAGYAREGAVAFSIGNKGYIGTGRTFGGSLQDFLEYDPLMEVTGNSELADVTISIYPNPASEFFTLNYNSQNNSEVKVNVYGVTGELVKTQILRQNQRLISIDNLTSGIYLVEILSTVGVKKHKLIIQR